MPETKRRIRPDRVGRRAATLKKSQTEKALTAFGSWEAREQGSLELVKELRRDWELKPVDRSR